MRTTFAGPWLAAAVCGCSPAAPATGQGIDAGDDAAATAPAEAGGDDASDATTPSPFASCGAHWTTGDFPADVGAVVQAKCQACHKQPPAQHAPGRVKKFVSLPLAFS